MFSSVVMRGIDHANHHGFVFLCAGGLSRSAHHLPLAKRAADSRRLNPEVPVKYEIDGVFLAPR